jgi:S1-C subfamily serine protease
MRLVCPHCDTSLKVSGRPEDDTAIKCPACKKYFVAGDPDDDDDDEDDDRPVRKKKSKKGQKKVPLAAVLGVGLAVLAVVPVVILVATSDDKPKPTVAKEEDPLAAAPPAPAPTGGPSSELRTMVTEMFRAPAKATPVSFTPSLDPDGDEPVVPTFASLKPRAAPPKAAKDPDPTKVVEEVSKSTVYIKLVVGGQAISSGSGFVIGSEGSTALVATNHHVIRMALEAPPGAIRPVVVFDSGLRATEEERPGTVVAHDKDADLAILRVPGVKRMPPAIDPLAGPTPTTTMPVLTCGFPFGVTEAAMRGSNPNISVSVGTVSSIKTGKTGEMDQVQIDGFLNQGNSGGPVVERATGRLVGIAVSIISTGVGPGLSFAVPAPKLVALTEGKVSPPTFSGSKVEGGQVTFAVEVPVADPFRKVKSVTLHVNPGKALAKEKDPATGWKLAPAAQAVELTYDPGNKATGQVRLPAGDKTAPVAVQLSCKSIDGTVAVSPPVTYTLDREGVPSVGEPIPMADVNRSPEKYSGQTVVLRGKMQPTINGMFDVFELTVAGENNAPAANLQFLVGPDMADQLKHVPDIPAHPVQLTCQVGKAALTGKTLVRVIRIDFMGKGNRVTLTVPKETAP